MYGAIQNARCIKIKEKIMAEYKHNPMCGLHGANVVVSEYNKNGECECLKCGPWVTRCENCEQYKALQKEATEKNQLDLERCKACLRQK